MREDQDPERGSIDLEPPLWVQRREVDCSQCPQSSDIVTRG